MESFHMTFNEVLWGVDWINLKLLMFDKLHYVGTDKKKSKDKVQKSNKLSKNEEYEAIRKLITE